MDIMLNKMQLPPGLITDEPWAAPWVEEEDGQLKEVCIQPSPAEAGIIVPYEKPKVPSTKKGGSASSLPPLPAIFASILGEATCEIKVSSVETPGDAEGMDPPVEHKLPSSKASMTIAAAMKSALDFVPSVVGMLGKKAKAKAKAKPQGKAEAKAKPSKGSKKPSSKKTKGKKMDSKKKSKDPEAKDAPKAADNAVCNTYVPGDLHETPRPVHQGLHPESRGQWRGGHQGWGQWSLGLINEEGIVAEWCCFGWA